MNNPMIRIHNQETGEVIDREMTDDEFAQFEADQAAQVARQEAEATKAADKAAAQAKLAALGLTQEEIAALSN
jgi:hypothetical protein